MAASSVFLHFTILSCMVLTTSSANSWVSVATIDSTTQTEYMYISQCMDWDSAQQYCSTKAGGQLASASLPEQRAYLQTMLIDSEPIGSCTNWPGNGFGIWLGGLHNGTVSSTVDTTSVHWFDGTVTPFNDIDWDEESDEPNNYQGGNHKGIGLHYKRFKFHTTYLGDSGCAFVCQRTVSRITAKPSTVVTIHLPGSSTPTVIPTLPPTTTTEPTLSPTMNPATQMPTYLPTNAPTDLPSINPSTLHPSFNPTTTYRPTNAPTYLPSVNPFALHPTLHPTGPPTKTVTNPPMTPNPSSNPHTFAPTYTTFISTSNPIHQTSNPTLHPSSVITTLSRTDSPSTATQVQIASSDSDSKDDSQNPSEEYSNQNSAEKQFEDRVKGIVLIILAAVLGIAFILICMKQIRKRQFKRKRSENKKVFSSSLSFNKDEVPKELRQHAKAAEEQWSVNPMRMRPNVGGSNSLSLSNSIQKVAHQLDHMAHAPHHPDFGDVLKKPISTTAPPGTFVSLNMSRPASKQPSIALPRHSNAMSMDSDAMTYVSSATTHRSNGRTHRSNDSNAMSLAKAPTHRTNGMTHRPNAMSRASNAMTHISYATSVDGGVITGASRRDIGERSVANTDSEMGHQHSQRRTNLGMEGMFLQVIQMADASSQQNVLYETNEVDANPVVPPMNVYNKDEYQMVNDDTITGTSLTRQDVVLPNSYETANGNLALIIDDQDALPQTAGKDTAGHYGYDHNW